LDRRDWTNVQKMKVKVANAPTVEEGKWIEANYHVNNMTEGRDKSHQEAVDK
jgi:hypothetical protein